MEAPSQAAELGRGRLAFRVDERGCEPQDVGVLSVGDLTPDLAVAVDGRPGSVFILGARCAGYEGAERVRCILGPLRLDDRLYTGARYPAAAPADRLVPAEAVGEAVLGGEAVTAVRLEGIDPAVAVGVEGRPGEAFVAAGTCPYERFEQEEPADDLLRCLQAPLWLIFELEEPPAAQAGDTVTARADRPVAQVVDGAVLSLVPREGNSDVLPSATEGEVQIGTISVDAEGRVSLPVEVPDVPTGVYEAVVTCGACAEPFGARRFAAGPLAIAGRSEGSSGPRIVGIAIGALLFVAIIGAVVAWRRGWGRRRAPAESDAADSPAAGDGEDRAP